MFNSRPMLIIFKHSSHYEKKLTHANLLPNILLCASNLTVNLSYASREYFQNFLLKHLTTGNFTVMGISWTFPLTDTYLADIRVCACYK